MIASLTDLFGGRSGTYENELIKAREGVIEELKSRASMLGANAVVGIDIDYEVLGANGSMLMVSVTENQPESTFPSGDCDEWLSFFFSCTILRVRGIIEIAKSFSVLSGELKR